MSEESQVNKNFADYDKLDLMLFAEEKQVWLVGCLRQAVKSASVRNGNVALFSKIRHCASHFSEKQSFFAFKIWFYCTILCKIFW